MDKISTIKTRILTFLEKSGIKKVDFYQEVGLKDSNFKGRNLSSQPGGEMIIKILTSYPNLSAEWLLTGRGAMLKGGVLEDDIPKAQYTEELNEGIPLIPLDAMAGAFTGGSDAISYSECEHYKVPMKADFLITVKGDSMIPTYNSGDIVACKKVYDSGMFFQWNRVYVLDTDQGTLIKRVQRGSDKNHLLIISDNKEYQPFEMTYEGIYNIALVVGVIKLE